LVGKAVPVLVVLAAHQAVILGFGALVLGMRVADVGLLAVAVAAWALTLLCVGAALGTLLRSEAEFAAVADIGSFVFTGLGGALVPLANMPGWARDLAPASPGYWAMSALRGALAGEPAQVLRAATVPWRRSPGDWPPRGSTVAGAGQSCCDTWSRCTPPS
jgi:ABC-2 type transport system permease protein